MQANAATKYFNPALSASRAAGQRGRRATSRRSTPSCATRPGRRARWPRAASTSRTSSPTPTRRRPRSATRTRRSTQALGAAARHAAQGQHDVRQPARDARRPRRARRRVQAGDEGPRAASCASCARSCTTRARRSPTSARSSTAAARTTTSPTCWARRRRSRRPPSRRSRTRSRRCSKATPVLKFIRPYTPDFVGWLRDFGQGAANYDANGHFARIQPIFNAYSFDRQPDGGS